MAKQPKPDSPAEAGETTPDPTPETVSLRRQTALAIAEAVRLLEQCQLDAAHRTQEQALEHLQRGRAFHNEYLFEVEPEALA